MTRIGLLSDTHGTLPEKMYTFFENVDEVWHAGDIGSPELVLELEKFKTLRAVWGNIDNHKVRAMVPEVQRFTVEQCKVLMLHIGGYPGKYTSYVQTNMRLATPNIFISGHSHILKVMFDKKHQCLHINPGAAGNYGLHHVITMVRFEIEGREIKNLEIFEKAR